MKQRRYIICLNEEEAEKDAAAREAILDRLRKLLQQRGAKALLGNRGFVGFVKRYVLRADLQGVAYQAFAAPGMRPPPPSNWDELNEITSVVPSSFFIPVTA